jgi:hypothetical protein|tara:strand:- start:4479 stop:6704 length:2226 start_codon:yes stop_codon:yes gene_type:complete
MGVGAAFAASFFGEINDIKRREAAARREEELKSEEFQNQIKLMRARVDYQADIDQAKYDREADDRKDDAFMTWFGHLDDTERVAAMRNSSVARRLRGIIGVGAFGDAFSTANLMDEGANSYAYAGGANLTLSIPRSDEDFTYKDYGIFDEGRMFWSDMNTYLSDETRREEFVNFMQNEVNAEALKMLANDVRKNEANVRVGWRNSQTRDNPGRPASEIQSYDLRGTHSHAVEVFELLGLANAEDDVRSTLKHELVYDETKEDVLFLNVEGMRGGTAERQEPVIMSLEDIQDLTLLADQTGYKDAQDLALGFSFTGVYEPEEGETRGEAAMKQNNTLIQAARLNRKYGNYIRSASTDPTQDRAFMQDLAVASGGTMEGGVITGANRNKMVNILAMLRPTPAGLFKKPKKNIFASNEHYQMSSNVRVAEFMAERSGIKKEDFVIGFKAQQDTIVLLDRLIELETVELSEATGQVRDLIGFGKAMMVQLKQLGNTGAELLGIRTLLEDKIFTDNTKQGTDEVSITNVVNKLRDEGVLDIDLAELSEADAIRLSLAAKMARAIDPAGRLSNQDFEIQLRRLGGGNLDTPEGIARKLATVKAEFERDLITKSYMNKLYETNAEITPGAARRIDAYFELRGFEGLMYGSGLPYQMTTDTGEVVSNVAGEAGAATVETDIVTVTPEAEKYFKTGSYRTKDGADAPFGYDPVTKEMGVVVNGEFIPFGDFEKREIVKIEKEQNSGNTAN